MTARFHAPTEHEWNKAVQIFDERHFMHAWAWGEFQQAMGRTVERAIATEGKTTVAMLTATVHPARRGRYLEVGAAVLARWERADVRRALTAELRRLARKNNCVFVRLRPQLENNATARKWLTATGWRRAPMHLHAEDTTIIDISQSPNELLKNMRQQTRYEVRKADRLGITVAWANHRRAIDEFYTVQQTTAERQGFVAPSKATLAALTTTYAENARIYVASLNGEALAYGLILIDAKEAVYYEAASTPSARKTPAAYGLQWHVMQDLQALGCQRYNLWGIAPEGAEHHRYSGVTTFKRGFGGATMYYVPAHDLVVQPLKYRLVHLIETARKKKRGL